MAYHLLQCVKKQTRNDRPIVVIHSAQVDDGKLEAFMLFANATYDDLGKPFVVESKADFLMAVFELNTASPTSYDSPSPQTRLVARSSTLESLLSHLGEGAEDYTYSIHVISTTGRGLARGRNNRLDYKTFLSSITEVLAKPDVITVNVSIVDTGRADYYDFRDFKYKIRMHRVKNYPIDFL